MTKLILKSRVTGALALVLCMLVSVQSSLAYSYDDIVNLVTAEHRAGGTVGPNASLDERLNSLEIALFGSPCRGAEKTRLAAVCLRLGIPASGGSDDESHPMPSPTAGKTLPELHAPPARVMPKKALRKTHTAPMTPIESTDIVPPPPPDMMNTESFIVQEGGAVELSTALIKKEEKTLTATREAVQQPLPPIRVAKPIAATQKNGGKAVDPSSVFNASAPAATLVNTGKSLCNQSVCSDKFQCRSDNNVSWKTTSNEQPLSLMESPHTAPSHERFSSIGIFTLLVAVITKCLVDMFRRRRNAGTLLAHRVSGRSNHEPSDNGRHSRATVTSRASKAGRESVLHAVPDSRLPGSSPIPPLSDSVQIPGSTAPGPDVQPETPTGEWSVSASQRTCSPLSAGQEGHLLVLGATATSSQLLATPLESIASRSADSTSAPHGAISLNRSGSSPITPPLPQTASTPFDQPHLSPKTSLPLVTPIGDDRKPGTITATTGGGARESDTFRSSAEQQFASSHRLPASGSPLQNATQENIDTAPNRFARLEEILGPHSESSRWLAARGYLAPFEVGACTIEYFFRSTSKTSAAVVTAPDGSRRILSVRDDRGSQKISNPTGKQLVCLLSNGRIIETNSAADRLSRNQEQESIDCC